MRDYEVREAFEAWARENGFAGFELRCRDDGSYIRTETNDAEAAYAAGHAAVAADLAAMTAERNAAQALIERQAARLRENDDWQDAAMDRLKELAALRALAEGES